jgi:hypothetical protein
LARGATDLGQPKKWIAEAKRYYPYADAETITPRSRRQVLREAKAQHERIAPLIEQEVAR